MAQGVMMVNAQRVVEVCNRRALDLLGLPAELMASKPTFEAVLAYQWSTDEFVHTPLDVQEFVRSRRHPRPTALVRPQRPDGRCESSATSVSIEGGGVAADLHRRHRPQAGRRTAPPHPPAMTA
jgi:PAS domain-containing protein